MAVFKTNVMRLLDQKKVPYTAREYPHGDEAVDGVTVARLLNLPVESVFKTLVTKGAKGGYYVFVVPVAKELNLSTETVNWYRKRLLAKFNVKNTVGLVRTVFEQKLL